MPESWPLSTRPPPNAQLSWSTATKEYDRVFVSSLARIAVETTRLVLINRLSVGCVEGFLGQAKPYTPKSAPARSSWNTFLSKPKARVVISFRSESSIRPMHLFGRTCDHDYYFELLPQEVQNAHSVSGCWIHTPAISGLFCVRTEFHNLLVVPFLTHHPVQTNRQSSRHGYLGLFLPRRIVRWKY